MQSVKVNVTIATKNLQEGKYIKYLSKHKKYYQKYGYFFDTLFLGTKFTKSYIIAIYLPLNGLKNFEKIF